MIFLGSTERIKHFVGQGANVNAKDKNQYTPIYFPAYAGKHPVTLPCNENDLSSHFVLSRPN